jgi:hypothetical protein
LNIYTFSFIINPELKQFLSIALLACFAMYHFGYYALYFSFDQHLESKWEQVIYSEKAIDVEETLLEIPLSAPYMANQEEFKPTNTSFEKDGQFFRAIKQRYQNDTLQIIVVKDTARGVLDNTVKKWISFLSGDEIPQDQNGNLLIQLLAKDYLQPEKYGINFSHPTHHFVSPSFSFFNYTNPSFQLDSPPPEVG